MKTKDPAAQKLGAALSSRNSRAIQERSMKDSTVKTKDTAATDQMLRELENLRARWIREARREFRLRQGWKDVESVAKSYGMDITYTYCAHQLDGLMKRWISEQRSTASDGPTKAQAE